METVKVEVSVTDYLLIMQGLRKLIEDYQEMSKLEGMTDMVASDLQHCDKLHKDLMRHYVGEESFNKLTEEGFFNLLYGGTA